MNFEICEIAAASPSVGQIQPRWNSTSSSTTLAPSSGGSSQYFVTISEIVAGLHLAQRDDGSLLRDQEGLSDRGIARTRIRSLQIQNERCR